MVWVTLFSQTGSEIVNVSRRLGRKPDLILTNNKNPTSWNPGIVEDKNNVLMLSVNDLHSHLMLYDRNCTITLHGYMRILPPAVCNKFANIYNGHPGDILKYPDLKGKDPQQKAFDKQYTDAGAVIHRVTAGVDEGPVQSYINNININGYDVGGIIQLLKVAQEELWVNFLRGKV